jgi:integrase/recombinase XerD
LVVGSFDDAAFVGAGADEGDEVGCVDGAPAALGGLDELEGHGDAGSAGARSDAGLPCTT